MGDALPRWRQRIELQTGWTLAPAGETKGGAAIKVVIRTGWRRSRCRSDESYRLAVTPQGATLTANTRFGALHGMETLLQLLQTDGQNTFLPLVDIRDVPRFPWRGVLFGAPFPAAAGHSPSARRHGGGQATCSTGT